MIRPPAGMLDPAAEIKREPGHLESRALGLGGAFEFFNLVDQLFGYSLIRIETEDPIVAGLLSGEVLLSRITRPGPHEYPIGERARNFNGAIGAFRVYDNDFICPRQGFERIGDVVLFVESDNRSGDLH